MEALMQPVLAKVEQERLDKIKEETTQVAIEKIKMKMEQDDGQNLGKLSFVDDDDDDHLYSCIKYIVRLLHNVP